MSEEYFSYLTVHEEVLNTPIRELGLSGHARQGLQREGVDDVGDLMLWSEAEILGIRLFGTGYRDEIKGALAGMGLGLSQHYEGLEPPAGDRWVRIPYGMLLDKWRLILRSQLSRIILDHLPVEDAATRRVLRLLHHQFRIRKVGMLLGLTRADVLAFDWASHSQEPAEALTRVEAALAPHQLSLWEA